METGIIEGGIVLNKITYYAFIVERIQNETCRMCDDYGTDVSFTSTKSLTKHHYCRSCVMEQGNQVVAEAVHKDKLEHKRLRIEAKIHKIVDNIHALIECGERPTFFIAGILFRSATYPTVDSNVTCIKCLCTDIVAVALHPFGYESLQFSLCGVCAENSIYHREFTAGIAKAKKELA